MDSLAYLGEIKIVSQSFAPKGWALCNGQLMSINQNQALFAILGTVYGGDGVNNFALPDLRGRSPLGAGTDTPLGQPFGVQAQVLMSSQLPMHTHMLNVSNTAGNVLVPKDAYFANSGTNDEEYTMEVPDTPMSASFLAAAGSSQPISVMQPYTVLNFIIALTGVFPTRN